MSAALHAIVTMNYKSYASHTKKVQEAIIEEKVSINPKIATEGYEQKEEADVIGAEGGEGSEYQFSGTQASNRRMNYEYCKNNSSGDSVVRDNLHDRGEEDC